MPPHGNFLGGPIHGTGMFMPEFTSAAGRPETSQGGHPNVHYTVGCAGIVLEIDKETGKMRVLKAMLAVDVGKAINPDLVKGQIVGGIVQGLATALYEDIRYSPAGKLLNPNFTDYKIPTALDCPTEIVPIILETPQPDGPFGARGVGEHTMIAAAPIVADAIEDAVGAPHQDHAADRREGRAGPARHRLRRRQGRDHGPVLHGRPAAVRLLYTEVTVWLFCMSRGNTIPL